MAPGRTQRVPGAGTDVTSLITSYGSREEAQQAIESLAEVGFSVEDTAIVAQDIRFVEDVTGRTGVVTALAHGATSGAIAGALVAFLLGLFSLINPISSAFVVSFWGLIFGAVVGAICGALAWAFRGRRRGFSSVSRFEAGRFDVVVSPDRKDEAITRLRRAHVLRMQQR